MEKDAGPLITDARYHPLSGRVLVELSNGAMLAFPASAVPALAGADATALADIAIVDGGHMLHWRSLNAHLSYLSLLTDMFGARAHMVRLANPKPKGDGMGTAGTTRRRWRR